MKILDVGCGVHKHPKSVGMDKHKLPGVDIVHDIDKFPWPIRSNTFNMVICSHVLEHVGDLVKTMEEIWRISKSGAKIDIEVPYWKHILAYSDPTHKRFITEQTFGYFSNQHENKYYSRARFKVLGIAKLRENHKILPNVLFPYDRMKIKLEAVK